MNFMISSAVNAASMHELLKHELHDLYDGEHQIIEALPLLIEHATNADLKKAFRDHLAETKNHATRLERCFAAMKEEPKRMTCDGMKGIIKEGDHAMKGDMEASLKDHALIGAAQRVEHYEMAGYGTAREHAAYLGYDEVAKLLDETLDEEGKADKLLSSIAKSMRKELAAAS